MNVYPHSPEPNRPGADARNIQTDIVAYRVDAIPLQLPSPLWGFIGQNGGTLPIQYGPHPYIPGMFADDYSIEWLGGVQTVVKVKFSSNRQFRRPNPPPDRTEQGFSSWSQSSIDVITRVPVLMKYPKIIPLPSGASATKVVWTTVDLDIEETHAVSIWRGSLANYNPANGEAIIINQTNTLHQIPTSNGLKRCLRGAEFNQNSNRWEARYQWVLDPGTPRPADWVNTPTRIYPPTVATISGVEYIRLPWQKFVVTPSSNPELIAPTIGTISTKRENLNGWTQLPPGIPPP